MKASLGASGAESIDRADWRFLLPGPEPAQVLCLGAIDAHLVQAMRSLGWSVRLGRVDTPAADLVVLDDPSLDELRQAADALTPWGRLYVQTRRGRRSRPRHTPRNRDRVRLLRRLGFAEIQLYWHWPAFETCAEIVPLDDLATVRHSLRRRSGRPAQVVAALLRGPLARPLLALVASDVSIIAVRREGAGRWT